MSEVSIPQMSDVDVKMVVRDKSGVLQDLATGIDNMVVFVSHSNGTLLSKYSVTPSAGYEPLNNTAALAGEVSFRLTSAVSKLAAEGKYKYELLIRKTDAALADGQFDRIVNDKYLFTITKSFSATETLP